MNYELGILNSWVVETLVLNSWVDGFIDREIR